MNRVAIWTVLSCIILSGCVSPQDKFFKKLPPGVWRGVLIIDEPEVQAMQDDEEVSYKVDRQGELPFNFEVVYDTEDDFHIEIINGDERIVVDDIIYGLDRATAKDTLIANFPVYDTYIRAIYEDNMIEGDWFVNYKDGYSIPFKAYHGQDHRFTTTKVEPVTDLSGQWATTFDIDTEDSYPAIAEFKQDGNRLSGTFKTETGDYRYLDGTIQANKLYLSTFDGAHAFLFLGKVLEDGSITGIFKSGKHYVSNWAAVRDATATLPDMTTLTTATTADPISFAFKNSDGNLVSLEDDRYDDKVKIIDIMGTWCPNCKDASDYLKGIVKDYDIEVIALAYERYDEAQSLAQIKRYEAKAQLPWPVLYGGSYRKSEASKTFPQIDKIMSYPTLIVLDRDNRISKIYTGFNGPATSEYTAFDQSFRQHLTSLINQ
jgi:thiol-disulfide isomerase/thioredoxin